MAKEGSTIGGLMDAIATLVSVSLQYGVPVESLVRKFEHVRFEPSGMTRNPEIPFAKSLVDYIFRWLAMEFVPGYRAANAPKRQGKGSGSELRVSSIRTRRSVFPGERQGEGPPKPLPPKPSKTERQRPRTASHPDAIPVTHDDDDAPASPHPTPARLHPHGSNLRLAIVADPLSQQGTELQADAPACDVCGSITVRSGTCYKCLNCGNSMGCS